MDKQKARNSYIRCRKIHQWAGLGLGLLFIFISLTGIALAWKKQWAVLQPPTQRVPGAELQEFLPAAQLADSARLYLAQHQTGNKTWTIDRMDLRPAKGVVKVRFAQRQWELQLDATTGAVLGSARRHADWVEALHDFSIGGEWAKLLLMNLVGLGLILMAYSGFMLWWLPHKMRRR